MTYEGDSDKLTSADPQPPVGAIVRDDMGVRRFHVPDGYGGSYWINLDNDEGDPESWGKIAGNYGPVAVLDGR